jgi:UDP-glucose 4-epimerase
MTAKTCVIGGGGFIGHNLVDLLVSSGREVIVLGRKPTPSYEINHLATYHQCDYTDRAVLCDYLDDVSEILDLAYSTVPQTSFQNPIYDLQSNLPGNIGLIEEVCKRPHIKKVLFVSSGGTVYGDVSTLPISEDTPNAPVSPYGITKLTIERYLLMYHKLHNLPAVIVRPSNAYGLGQKPFTGQGFIATAMGMILQHKPVTVFGENGSIRDYIHVKDVATGLVAALDQGINGQVYNIGSGVGRSSREVIEAIAAIAIQDGYELTIQLEPKRGFDVEANVLNFGKLLACSGWLPKITFEQGLKEMWDYLRNNSSFSS